MAGGRTPARNSDVAIPNGLERPREAKLLVGIERGRHSHHKRLLKIVADLLLVGLQEKLIGIAIPADTGHR